MLPFAGSLHGENAKIMGSVFSIGGSVGLAEGSEVEGNFKILAT